MLEGSQLLPLEKQENTSDSESHSTENTKLGETGQKLTEFELLAKAYRACLDYCCLYERCADCPFHPYERLAQCPIDNMVCYGSKRLTELKQKD